jgi:hypothetical protein
MANERISQLNNLPAANVASNDLFVISDMSLPESKNLTAIDLKTYVLGSGISSSSYSSNSNLAKYATSSLSSSWASSSLNSISSSHSATSSLANIATYALNAPTAAQVSYATSSLSASWASSSLSSISSSFANTSSYSTTSSYALVTGMAIAYAENSQNAVSASYASSAGSADIASVALSLVNSDINQSGNIASITTHTNIVYNTSSFSSGETLLVTESVIAQIDEIRMNNSLQTSSLVNITACGLVAVLHNTGSVYSSIWNPKVSLIVQNLMTGDTQILSSASYNSYLQGVDTTITNTSSIGAIQPFYLTNNTHLSAGSYRTYVEASYLDIGDNSISFYFYGMPDTTPSFRLSSDANIFVVTSDVSGIPILSSDQSFTCSYSASYNSFGIITSSSGNNTIQNLTATTPSSESYLTYLNSNENIFNTLTNLWTATSLNTLILNSSSVSSIDGVPLSLVTMSCQNCNLSTLPPLYNSNVAYLDVSNTVGGGNNISDLSALPLSMSYLNVSRNPIIRKWPLSMMKGIQYLNVSYCELAQYDLDIITSMLVAEVSASNIIGGTLDISNNNISTNTNTIAWYNKQLLTSSLYSWTVNY